MVQSRLLDIAIREFSQKGLVGASTRSIASAADTVMSSITYHYGGKEGLYLAAADYIAEHMTLATSELVEPIEGITADQARARIHRLLGSFADKMIAEENAEWSLFIVREQMNPTGAFERIYDGLMGRMMERLADLVCIASGRRDVETVRVATISLLGQVIVLRAARSSCLKLLQRATIDDQASAAIRHRLDANIDAVLDTLTAEPQEPQ